MLKIPAAFGNNDAVLEYETEAVARTIEAAVSGRDGAAVAEPGDFLIISALKRNLSLYAARLHELGIPCEVTGGAVLNEIRELALLCLCLEALAEPDNPFPWWPYCGANCSACVTMRCTPSAAPAVGSHFTLRFPRISRQKSKSR